MKNLIEQVREIINSEFSSSNSDKLESLYIEIIRESGYLNKKINIYYDINREEYLTVNRENGEIKVYSTKKSLESLILRNYKGIVNTSKIIKFIPTVALEFNPHRLNPYVTDENIKVINSFIPNKFLSYMPPQRIPKINHDKYPNIYKLLKNLFVRDEYIYFFENWLGFGMQHRRKAMTAIISKGVEGTGKGLFYSKIIKKAFGDNYCAILGNDGMRSNFNGILEGKLFVLMNEVKPDFRDFSTIHERLKEYIADEEFTIEEKHQKMRVAKTYFNAWLHTNHEIPLHITPTDRRYTVIETNDKKLKDVISISMYKFVEKIEEESEEYIYDLMSLKIDKDLASSVLQNEAREKVINATTDKTEIIVNLLKAKDIDGLVSIISDCHGNDVSYDMRREIEYSLNQKNAIASKWLYALYKCFVNSEMREANINKRFDKWFKQIRFVDLHDKRVYGRKIK